MKIALKAGMLLREQPRPTADAKSSLQHPPIHRIIGIRKDHRFSEAALIRCDAKEMPRIISLQCLENDVAVGDYIVVDESENPAAPGIRCVEDLGDRAEDFSAKMAANMKLIAPVINLGWSAFYLTPRAKAIDDIATGEERHAKSWIRQLLWAFWAGGSLAVGPQYHKCGALTRAERLKRARMSKSPIPEMKRCGRTRKHIGEERSGPAYQRGGCCITPKCEAAISSVIERYFSDKENMSVVRISLERRGVIPWKAIRDHVQSELNDLPEFKEVNPSVAQVTWIGKKCVNVIEVTRAALGRRYSDLNHRAFTGDYRDVTIGAGHRYELDASTTDIHLVDDVTGHVIGRVNVVWVVDSYSGMIVGVYVTTEDITFAHVARALHGTFSSKAWWCSLFDLKIQDADWPCDGRCGHLTADNAQMITKAATAFPEFISDSGICPSYRPDLKGTVEFTAEFANIGLIHFFHYGVSKGPKERAQEDRAKKAVVSVQSFTRELVRWVVNVANHRPLPVDRQLDPAFIATGALPTPFNVWNWSVGVHGGPPSVYDSAHWMPRLLERAQATVTPHGLELDGVYFDDLSSTALQEMKRDATATRVTHLPVHVDRLTTKQVYLVPDEITQPPVPVPLAHLSRDYAGMTFDEVASRIAFRKAKLDDAEIAYNRRKKTQQKRVKAAAAAGKADVETKHGSIANRNKTAAGTDIEATSKTQAKSDNAKITDAMHGAPTTSSDPASTEQSPPSPPAGVRPGCLSS